MGNQASKTEEKHREQIQKTSSATGSTKKEIETFKWQPPPIEEPVSYPVTLRKFASSSWNLRTVKEVENYVNKECGDLLEASELTEGGWQEIFRDGAFYQ